MSKPTRTHWSPASASCSLAYNEGALQLVIFLNFYWRLWKTRPQGHTSLQNHVKAMQNICGCRGKVVVDGN